MTSSASAATGAKPAGGYEAALYQGIVDSAAAVTGARYVNLSWREADGYIRGSAWAMTDRGRFERALTVVRRALPGFDPAAVRFRVDVNPAVKAVLVDGRPVFAPFREHVERTVHPVAAQAAMTILGLEWTHSVPLKVSGRVAGALAFHWSEAPVEQTLKVAEAFSEQCALTLENMRLSEALAERAREIERSRERIAAAEERTRREIAELLHGRVETRLLVTTQRLLEARDLARTDPATAVALLGEVADEFDRIRDDDVRGASHRLHPSVIGIGVVPALQMLAEAFEIDVAVSASPAVLAIDDIARNALPRGLRLAAYRFAEASVERIARSGAPAARVEVDAGDDALRISVSSEARGVAADDAFSEPALRAIDDGIEQVGGSVERGAGPSGGIVLTARVPIPSASATGSEPHPDGSVLYQRIVDNALVVTGARFVSLSWYDPRALQHELGAAAPRSLFRATLAAAQAVIPGFDASWVRFRADVNPATRTVLIEGHPLLAPFTEHAAGTLHPAVLKVVGAIMGLRWTHSVPLRADGAVAGALAFHFRSRPADDVLSVAEAFARQVSLTLANARLSAALRARAEELTRSRERIAAAEERTRRGIAELLHGQVQTRLLVATHQLLEARRLIASMPDAAIAWLGDLAADFDRIREEDLRQAIQQLHPPEIAVGLIPALQQLADGLGPRLDVTIEASDAVKELDHPGHNRLPDPVRLGIYRAAEEALGNVARHARTPSASIRVDLSPEGAVLLTVSDRGAGFDPDEARSGVGMRSMRDRIEGLGGSLAIDSVIGRGTTLWVSLPLGRTT